MPKQTIPKGLKAPFPYFGGKSRIADAIWDRFGKVDNYVEPFFGSGAVLLSCPWPGHTETVNDADGLLANFWRALQADPDAVAQYADYPVSELDLHARHQWLVNRRVDVEQALADPDWYDARAAGWWVWGISQWIGGGWCPVGGAQHKRLPHLGGGSSSSPGKGNGVHRKSLAEPADVGQLSRQLPHVGNAGRGLHRAAETNLYTYLRRLSERLRRVRITCGDFARVLGPSVTWRHGTTAVLLDPPYERTERADVYAVESDAAARARQWAIENGDNHLLRIAYCGYDTGEAWPDGWSVYAWKTNGGYGNQGSGRGRANAARECVWFSSHCLNKTPMELLLEQD